MDKIFCKSSEKMEELLDNSLHLMVTSPPYNVGKEYDENLTLNEYRAFLKKVWSEVKRVLVPEEGLVSISPIWEESHTSHSMLLLGKID